MLFVWRQILTYILSQGTLHSKVENFNFIEKCSSSHNEQHFGKSKHGEKNLLSNWRKALEADSVWVAICLDQLGWAVVREHEIGPDLLPLQTRRLFNITWPSPLFRESKTPFRPAFGTQVVSAKKGWTHPNMSWDPITQTTFRSVMHMVKFFLICEPGPHMNDRPLSWNPLTHWPTHKDTFLSNLSLQQSCMRFTQPVLTSSWHRDIGDICKLRKDQNNNICSLCTQVTSGFSCI